MLCLLEDLRSRALALPVPFLDAGAMMACYEGVASVGCPVDLSGRGPGVEAKAHTSRGRCDGGGAVEGMVVV